eukprot:6221264-Amphidinium_carterae.1
MLHGVSEADRQGNERADKAANNVLGQVDRKQSTWKRYRQFAASYRHFLGLIGPVLGEKKDKLLVRPQLPVEEEEIIDDLEWPYAFEGHTLVREAAGLRCIECHKGASDIVGRPRWGYFREFRCAPKRRRGRPRRASQADGPHLLGRAGSTQARPGRARP